MKSTWRKLKSWFLCKYCGYIRVSDIVNITVGPMTSVPYPKGRTQILKGVYIGEK